MKKIALLNTAIASYNMGDYIIVDSIKKEVEKILEKEMVVEFSTHAPAFRLSAAIPLPCSKNAFNKSLKDFDYGLICGTNLLWNNMLSRQATWNVRLLESVFLKNCVFVGVGAGKIGKINWYTKRILKNSLSDKYIHSVRDEEAREMLSSIGIKSINTGCPTMWSLTREHCKRIPAQKSNEVIFTLTDYCKDEENDKKMINILKKNYEKVSFWIQGTEDLDYLKKITDINSINLIYPQLRYYDEYLTNHNCDYVGTRLHAGVRAMQKYRRSIIIIVDNRARSIKRDNNIVGIERDNIEELDRLIKTNFKTNIVLDEAAISSWKSQFER